MTKKKEVEQLITVDEILASIQLNLKVAKEKTNAFGKYKYRNAEDILEAVKSVLKKNEDILCSIITNIEPILIADRFFIKCTAILAFGENKKEADGYAELERSKKGMDLAQLTGAATSYAKKYALGNLFAIDDSKDDPDSNDNTKIDSDRHKLGNIAEENMKETLREANEKDFARIKKAIEDCGSVAEIDGVVEKEKSNINKLNKYAKDLFTKLKDCKEAMIEIIEPSEEPVDYTAGG